MDNTMCCTSEKILEYEKKFLSEKQLEQVSLWENQNLRDEFLNKYLEKIYCEAKIKDYVIEVLNNLKEKGNMLYIITARSEKYVSDIYQIINEYVKVNNIKIDGIFINSKDKVDICLENNIDLMIEDSRYNYDKLVENNICTILFEEKNNNIDVDNRVSS